MKFYSRLIFLSFLSIFVLSACSKKEEATMAPLQAKEEMAEPGIKDAPMGIPVCDAFLGKYKKCIAQLPEVNAKPMEEGLIKAEENWRKLAKQEKDHDKLVKACNQITAALEESMTAQGCEW